MDAATQSAGREFLYEPVAKAQILALADRDARFQDAPGESPGTGRQRFYEAVSQGTRGFWSAQDCAESLASPSGGNMSSLESACRVLNLTPTNSNDPWTSSGPAIAPD